MQIWSVLGFSSFVAQSRGQAFTVARNDVVSKCLPTGYGGAGGNYYVVGIVESSNSVAGGNPVCVSMMQGVTLKWETRPVPLDGYYTQDARDLLKVAPSGGYVLLGGSEQYAGTINGFRVWAALVDATGSLVWKVPSATPLLVTDTVSYLARGREIFKVNNLRGAQLVKLLVTIPIGHSVFAAARAAPSEPVFYAYNQQTSRLTRLGQSSVVPANFLDSFGFASNTARFYVYNYTGTTGATRTDLVGFDNSATTFKVNFMASVRGIATELAVSPGNVYAAVCGFARLSTSGLAGDVPLFVQRIHLASKTLAYYEIPRPSTLGSSTTMACSEDGLSVKDNGEVVVGTAQTTSGFFSGTVTRAVIYRFTGTSTVTTLTMATSTTADKLGATPTVKGPIQVKAAIPAQYTVSVFKSGFATVVTFQDPAMGLRR